MCDGPKTSKTLDLHDSAKEEDEHLRNLVYVDIPENEINDEVLNLIKKVAPKAIQINPKFVDSEDGGLETGRQWWHN